jgi:hypothetical protein
MIGFCSSQIIFMNNPQITFKPNIGVRPDIETDKVLHWNLLLCAEARYGTVLQHIWTGTIRHCSVLLFRKSGLLHPTSPAEFVKDDFHPNFLEETPTTDGVPLMYVGVQLIPAQSRSTFYRVYKQAIHMNNVVLWDVTPCGVCNNRLHH